MLSSSTYNLLWIIGHEIGHIANSHEYSHFDLNEFDRTNSNNVAIKQENEADFFAIEAINSNQELELEIGGKLLLGLSNVLQFHHLENCYIKESHTIDKCTGDFKIIQSSNSHPPMFCRATDMLIILDSTYLLHNQKWLHNLKSRIKISYNESF